MKRSSLGSWIWAALTAVVALAAPATADQRYFTYTYDWFTPTKNEKEVELYWTQRSGGNVDAELEFEYGLTNRWTIAPYLLLGRSHGEDTEVRGWKVEQRYRLGKFAYNRLLPAFYLEVAKENGSPFELEGKFITSYLFGNGWIWSNNLIVEQPMRGHAPLEFAYATGVSHPVGGRWHAGVELFGNFHDKSHFIGPTVNYRFNNTTQLLATVGVPFSGDEGGAVRFLFEKEWH